MTSRRSFLVRAAGSAAALIAGGTALGLVGCGSSTGVELEPGGGLARLTARPGTPTQTVSPGSVPITPGNANDGSLLVPASYSTSSPAPLVLSLHGAGIGPGGPINLWASQAEAHGILVLAVGARGLTWDVITSKFSYDVTFIDGALRWAFDRCVVDPARIVVQGFSDGATYALGLGLANGDLFTHTMAFSPGFIPASDSPATGKSKFFDSHGRQDPVLGIDNASRRIVPALRGRGYDVTYVEFDGGHMVPAEILSQAVDWMVR